MNILFAEDLKILSSRQQGPCVSIYLPAIRGAAANQNAIRFKNLFRQAQDQLSKKMRKIELEAFISPAQWLLKDSINWHQQCEAFAVFISSKILKVFRLSRRVSELAITGERFYTRPLIPLVFENGKFYIVAVSQKAVRFFEGANEGARELEFPNMPKGIDDILKQYSGERHLEFHTQTARQSGLRQAYFHGQGGGEVSTEDKVQEYLYQVDKCLHRYLQNEHVPLIFAGVEYLFPKFKQANSYQNLVDQPINGNPDRLTSEELHREAMAIVQPLIDEKKYQMLGKYRQFAGTEHGSADARQIILAAGQGRVEALFFTANANLWGKFDDESQTVELHETRQPESEDLLDLAVNETFLNSGSVYELEPGQLPKTTAAAILRW